MIHHSTYDFFFDMTLIPCWLVTAVAALSLLSAVDGLEVNLVRRQQNQAGGSDVGGSSSSQLRAWALSEKSKVANRYGSSSSDSSNKLGPIKRQENNSGGSSSYSSRSRIATATTRRSSTSYRRTTSTLRTGLAGSATSGAIVTSLRNVSTSTPTATAAPLLPTTPTVGYTNLTNYERDLSVGRSTS